MTVKQYDIESLLAVLRTFTYTTEVDGETVTVNAEVFTSGQIPIATKIFLQEYGSRVADEILDDYKKGDVSAAELGDMIKTLCVQRWKHFLEMWKVNYNPIWNVDGTETHTIVTKYGKITRMAKATTITDEQKVDGEVEVTYGQKLTDEQKVNGSGSITYGKTTTMTNPTSTGSVAAFDTVGFVGASQSTMTNGVNAETGSDSSSNSIGTVEHAQSGKDTTKNSLGKVEHAHSGTDTDTQDGSDTTTDTLTRGGNIGTTMTQTLLGAEDDFWSHYSFFTKYFTDIANVISLPIYE